MASTDPSELKEQALRLPAAARLELAQQLIDSVEGPEDPDWAAAWSAELTRRSKAFAAGEVEGIPTDEALSTIRSRLARS